MPGPADWMLASMSHAIYPFGSPATKLKLNTARWNTAAHNTPRGSARTLLSSLLSHHKAHKLSG